MVATIHPIQRKLEPRVYSHARAISPTIAVRALDLGSERAALELSVVGVLPEAVDVEEPEFELEVDFEFEFELEPEPETEPEPEPELEPELELELEPVELALGWGIMVEGLPVIEAMELMAEVAAPGL